MSDLISRSTLIEDADKHFGHPNAFYSNESFKELIDNQPTIEAVPVVHGEWVYRGIPNINGKVSIETWHCSNCDWIYDKDGQPSYDFCPECGARMKGGE